MGWLLTNITAMLAEVIGQFLDGFGVVINAGFMLTTVINNTTEVQNTIKFTVALAYMLLIAVTAKQIIDIYGLHSYGDANESPVEVVYRASVSSVLIAASELFFSEFYKFTSKLGVDIGKVTTEKTITAQCRTLYQIENLAVVGIIMTIVILVAVMAFVVIAAVRGAQLMLFRILFPIFAIDRSLTNKERWNNFIQSYVACFVGFIIQMLCFNMFRLSFTKIALDQGPEARIFAFIPAFGWLIMAIKSPAWLDKYVFKSGIGEALSRSLQSAGSIFMMRAI